MIEWTRYTEKVMTMFKTSQIPISWAIRWTPRSRATTIVAPINP